MSLSDYSGLTKLLIFLFIGVVVYRVFFSKKKENKTPMHKSSHASDKSEQEFKRRTSHLNASGHKAIKPHEVAMKAYISKDYRKAMDEWLPMAENDDANAQYSIGSMYLKGLGVLQDYKEAEKWITRSAVCGHVDAQYALGCMYAKAEGVPQDLVCALTWFNVAAANGKEEAVDACEIAQQSMSFDDVESAQFVAREIIEAHAEALNRK